jgi:hypothetical protein
MVRYVLLRPLRPELDVNKKNYRVRNRESESMATLVKLERALKISLTLRSIIPRSVVLWTLFYLFLSPIYCIYYRYEGSFLCGPEEVLLESAWGRKALLLKRRCSSLWFFSVLMVCGGRSLCLQHCLRLLGFWPLLTWSNNHAKSKRIPTKVGSSRRIIQQRCQHAMKLSLLTNTNTAYYYCNDDIFFNLRIHKAVVRAILRH